MIAAFWLLFINGLIGLYDAIVYHIYTFKLYKTQVTFWEQLTHWIRGFLFACFYLAVCVKATGVWWWIYPTLMVVEVVNTSIDTILEPHTRRTLGGIPPVEYTLHCLLLLIQGGALASMLWATLPYRTEADGIVWRPLDFGFFSWLPIFSAVSSLMLSTFEGLGFLRMVVARISGGARAASSLT
jgi:hypothetical protein